MNFILSFPISIFNIVETIPSLLVQYHVLTKCMYHHLRKENKSFYFCQTQERLYWLVRLVMGQLQTQQSLQKNGIN